MAQAHQLSLDMEAPHNNQYLFSDHYLNHLLPGDPRQHAPEYSRLVQTLAATDRLIDRIVYQLYGLTAEEIEIVEGP